MNWTMSKLKQIKPYFLVIHRESGKSAVYNRKYELMFESASAQLIDFAERYHAQTEPGFKLTYPAQQPSWMRPDIEGECVNYHLYNDGATVEALRAIPER